jgi:hypothetical protein
MTERNQHFFDGIGSELAVERTELDIASGACKMPSPGTYSAPIAPTMSPEVTEALTEEMERVERQRGKK